MGVVEFNIANNTTRIVGDLSQEVNAQSSRMPACDEEIIFAGGDFQFGGTYCGLLYTNSLSPSTTAWTIAAVGSQFLQFYTGEILSISKSDNFAKLK
mmetsp:Transcript_84529/g.126741  ORF Transcript_84529/g.126741 Transcript_84529/m.126741 type:complete len:97 (-) Transcript_84529:12-302(-)